MHSQIKYITAILAMLLISWQACAAIETYTFESDVDRLRYHSFIEEMRCPKCQNQNLAGSDSPISTDLRRELYEMIKAGKSDMEIVSFMVERYGDFILYRPRITPATYVLWGGPVVLLIGGIIVLIMMLRQRRRLAVTSTKTALTADDQARLHALLNDQQNNKLDKVNAYKNNPKKNKESP